MLNSKTTVIISENIKDDELYINEKYISKYNRIGL